MPTAAEQRIGHGVADAGSGASDEGYAIHDEGERTRMVRVRYGDRGEMEVPSLRLRGGSEPCQRRRGLYVPSERAGRLRSAERAAPT
jgi:hypothetical protein